MFGLENSGEAVLVEGETEVVLLEENGRWGARWDAMDIRSS
jgi:hypothetical protein